MTCQKKPSMAPQIIMIVDGTPKSERSIPCAKPTTRSARYLKNISMVLTSFL